MRRSKDLNHILKKDMEFWESVQQITFSLLRVIGRCFVKEFYQRPSDGDERIVIRSELSSQSVYSNLIANLCTFLSSSPDLFIPFGGGVCQVRGVQAPIVYTKRELLILLWKLTADSPVHDYITALYRQLDPIFVQGDDIEWDKSSIVAITNEESFQTSEAKMQLERVYSLWVQYIKRHYDRTLLGVTDQKKLETMIRCVDGLRNHLYPQNAAAVFYSARDLCDALMLVDDTLCFNGYSSFSDFPGPVMNKGLLEWLMYHGQFPGRFRTDIMKILRLYQKILIRRRKETEITGETACILYWNKNTEYCIYYDKKRKVFRYWTNQIQYPEFARKCVEIPGEEETFDFKDYLYELLQGSQNGLYELAKLTACCLCEPKAFGGVIVISAEQAAPLVAFLCVITGVDIGAVKNCESIHTLSLKKSIDGLIEMKLAGQAFAVCFDAECYGRNERMNPEQWTQLKKIFSGVHITCKDSILGRKIHKSTVQWLVIGDDRTIQKLQDHQIKVKRLTCSLQNIFPECTQSLWLRQILPLWGYLQLQKKKDREEKPSHKTVQHFIDHCCKLTKERVAFVPARALYDCYISCCNAQSWKDTLKFKDFNDILEADYGLKRIRHHFTNGENPTGFNHIAIVSAPDDSHAGAKKAAPVSEKESFFLKLEQMEQEVRTHFDQYPF